MDAWDKMQEAKRFARINLRALVVEILEWRATGLLNRGSGGLLREMSQMLQPDFHNLQIAESIVTDLALEEYVSITKE